jgi:hypothetical protein
MHIDVVVEDLDVAEAAVLELGATKHKNQPGTTFRVSSTPRVIRSASARTEAAHFSPRWPGSPFRAPFEAPSDDS